MLDASELEQFIRDHWARRTYLTRVSQHDFQALQEELAGFDVEALAHRNSQVSVWFEDPAGRLQAVDMPPGDAIKFYNAGMTVFLPDIKTPTIERWHATLAGRLGRHRGRFLCSIFASKRGNVTGCHFDHIENFTIQLRGDKTWRIADNPEVPLPTVNYSVRTERPYQEEMWLYAARDLPTAVPAGAQTVDVTPGSLLYVPRGLWHEVEAKADSVSLLFAFPAATWIDVMLPGLRTLLLRRLEWRENAIFAPDDEAAWRAAHDRIDVLREDLIALLQGLDPAELLPQRPPSMRRPSDEGAVLQRNRLATLGQYPTNDGKICLVATVHQGEVGRTREARVPSAWGPALRTLDRADHVTLDGLAAQHPELGSQVAKLVEVLVELEVLRAEATRP